jgi:hypothetical protein
MGRAAFDDASLDGIGENTPEETNGSGDRSSAASDDSSSAQLLGTQRSRSWSIRAFSCPPSISIIVPFTWCIRGDAIIATRLFDFERLGYSTEWNGRRREFVGFIGYLHISRHRFH